jgi:hypothetical protein
MVVSDGTAQWGKLVKEHRGCVDGRVVFHKSMKTLKERLRKHINCHRINPFDWQAKLVSRSILHPTMKDLTQRQAIVIYNHKGATDLVGDHVVNGWTDIGCVGEIMTRHLRKFLGFGKSHYYLRMLFPDTPMSGFIYRSTTKIRLPEIGDHQSCQQTPSTPCFLNKSMSLKFNQTLFYSDRLRFQCMLWSCGE